MNNDLLGAALTPIISEIVSNKMDELDIKGQIEGMLLGVAQNAQKIITVKLDGVNNEGEKFPLVHKQFEQLLQVVSIKGINTLLTGGAGLSKSTAVEQCARALQLELASISFSNQTTKTDLLGFVDAMGIYRKSGFVDAFENGKVFLADEMDACSANVLVLLNSAISNGFLETPDNKTIRVHETFRFVATANTNLRGSTNGFTARNKLDSATIDRFVVIDWELDEDLESLLTNNDGWVAIVRKARDIARERLEGVVITPRSSYDGAKLLMAGIDVNKVIDMTIVKAMGDDARNTILSAITDSMKTKAMNKKVNLKKPEQIKVVEGEIKVAKTEWVEPEKEKDEEFNWGIE